MQSGAQILKEQCVEESSGKVFKIHIPGPHPQRLLIIQEGRSDAQKSVLAVASPPPTQFNRKKTKNSLAHETEESFIGPRMLVRLRGLGSAAYQIQIKAINTSKDYTE